jgi:hypothetical protein
VQAMIFFKMRSFAVIAVPRPDQAQEWPKDLAHKSADTINHSA